MSIDVGSLMGMIQTEAKAVKAQMQKLAAQGSSINVSSMIMMQLTMNKFSQIADLGSTTISIFNSSFKTMINNVLR